MGHKISFAQLADPATTHFNVEATRFMAGKFPLMIFGLPGAAFAIYRCARPEQRKVVGGLMISAALTSMLTGITEPLEFTFYLLHLDYMEYIVFCRTCIYDDACIEDYSWINIFLEGLSICSFLESCKDKKKQTG